jgi:SCY1-like protein 2
VSEMEISRGLLNLAEGLQYLHTVQRKLHLNVAPESVVITAEGNWKFCSFGLSLAFQQGETLKMPSPYFLKVDPNSHILRLEPDLRYSGLELTTGGYNPQGIRYLTPSTDVFALGVLAFEVYRFNIQQAPHACIIGVVNNNVNYHLPALEALSVLDYSFLPPSGPAGGIKEILRGMMDLQVRTRFSTDMISSHPFCSTGAIAFLRTVDTLAARDVGTQASLLLSLPQHMTAFPPRLLERTVLPTICKLCVGNPGLWTHSLHIHIYMTERMTVQKYRGTAYLLMHVVHPVLSFVSELFTTNVMISFLIYFYMHIIYMRTQPLHCRTVIIILFFILSLSLSLSLSLPLS